MGRLMSRYRLVYSETSRKQIAKLHPTLKPIIRARLDRLQEEPFSGKNLERELSGYKSFRTGRFRIIYRLNEEKEIIEIHYIGRRKDVYELFAEEKGLSAILED
jgi:mRNA interferase RelE/StbE